jgi:hypothetical protein
MADVEISPYRVNLAGRTLRAQGVAFFVGALAALCPGAVLAGDGRGREEHAGNEVDHTIIVGVGGAAELELADGSVHPGTNVMLEWDAIENWLELEVSASVLTADKGIALPIDLLVKKPFRVARWFELMVGIGPEVIQVTGVNRGLYFGGQVALDFMFWPSRRFGLWVEPSYELIFQRGISHGLASTGGLLIGF